MRQGMDNENRPSVSDAKAHFRKDVWCWHCMAPRWFVFDPSNGTQVWKCTVCKFVEHTADRELAPSPWIERHHVSSCISTRGT